MEASTVPLRGPLSWDDFAWLDEPAPVPPDIVKEPPADPLLGAICKGELISDMAIPQVVLPLFDKRTATNDFQGNMLLGAGLCTSKKLVPRKGASAAWLDDINDIIASQQLLKVAAEEQRHRHTSKFMKLFKDSQMKLQPSCFKLSMVIGGLRQPNYIILFDRR